MLMMTEVVDEKSQKVKMKVMIDGQCDNKREKEQSTPDSETESNNASYSSLENLRRNEDDFRVY